MQGQSGARLILVNAVWFGAVILAVAASLLFGPLAGAAAALVLSLAAAFLLLAQWRHASQAAHSEAARLRQNLDQAHDRSSALLAGLAALDHPLLLSDTDGTILAVSGGLAELAPTLVPGAKAGGFAANSGLVTLAGRRYQAHRSANAGGTALELVPAGHYIADDDLDAFGQALIGGQTGFRFEAGSVKASPALAVLNEGLEAIDRGVAGIGRLLEGEDIGPQRGNGGIDALANGVRDALLMLDGAREEEAQAREIAERKLRKVGELVEAYHQQAQRLAATAAEARADAGKANASVAAGRDAVSRARDTGKEVRSLAGNADQAARRTFAAIGGVDAVTTQIARMVNSIEDVSFRTNLIALNAAVEAARAGEKGAGFAVVAEEVRTLAQIANRSAREIRELVGRGQAQSGQGVAETEMLQKMIAEIDQHLRNLGNETDTIAQVLDEGSSALLRLENQVSQVGDAAGRTLGASRA